MELFDTHHSQTEILILMKKNSLSCEQTLSKSMPRKIKYLRYLTNLNNDESEVDSEVNNYMIFRL